MKIQPWKVSMKCHWRMPIENGSPFWSSGSTLLLMSAATREEWLRSRSCSAKVSSPATMCWRKCLMASRWYLLLQPTAGPSRTCRHEFCALYLQMWRLWLQFVIDAGASPTAVIWWYAIWYLFFTSWHFVQEWAHSIARGICKWRRGRYRSSFKCSRRYQTMWRVWQKCPKLATYDCVFGYFRHLVCF